MRYLVFLILLVQGCSFKPNFDESSTIAKYLIQKPVLHEYKTKLNQTVNVSLPVAPSYLLAKNITYSDTNGVHGSYVYHFWDENLVKQMQFLLAHTLSKRFSNVLISPSKIKHDLELESRIDTFDFIYDRKAIVLNVKLFLVNNEGVIINSKSLSLSQKIEKINPQGVVRGFNLVSQKLGEEVLAWLEQ